MTRDRLQPILRLVDDLTDGDVLDLQRELDQRAQNVRTRWHAMLDRLPPPRGWRRSATDSRGPQPLEPT